MRQENNRINKLVEMYNIIPSAFWSVINFTPVAIFCYGYIEMKWFYIFLIISVFPYLLPNSFFNMIRLGKTEFVYKKIGIRIARKLVQGGDLVNSLIRKKIPQYRIINNSRHINTYLAKTYFIEKFHYSAFVFFLLISIYALAYSFVLFALVIVVNNIIFNVYPVLLQQYNRLRLNKVAEKLRTG